MTRSLLQRLDDVGARLIAAGMWPVFFLLRNLPRFLVKGFFEHILIRPALWPALPQGKSVRLNLARMLTHLGKASSPLEIDRCIEEKLALTLRQMLFAVQRPEEVKFARERVDLELLPEVERLRRQGRGVILALPHLGLPVHASYALSLRVPWRLPVMRKQMGRAFIPAETYEHLMELGDCAADCLRALRANEVLFIFMDANFLSRPRTTLFFGAPARLGYGAARLALASGAPILPAYAESIDNGKSCRFKADAPIFPQKGTDTVTSLNEQLARFMERTIGRRPGQWTDFSDPWDLNARISPEQPYRVRWSADWQIVNGELTT